MFISHLETTARSGQGPASLFRRARTVFSSIIDEILEPRSETAVDDTDLGTILNFDIDNRFFLDLQGMDLLETPGFRVAFDEMLYQRERSDLLLTD